MTHRVINRTRGEGEQSVLHVALQPQTFSELLAIKNVMMLSASADETAMIDDYLLLEASNGLPVSEIRLEQGHFTIQVAG